MHSKTVSELVRNDYRAAEVFKKWGINYCCGGNLPLAQVCELQGLDEAAIASDLEQASRQRSLPATIDFNNWPLPFLIDYIQHVHHAYARNAGLQLQQHLETFVAGHLKKYPYLAEVQDAFKVLMAQLLEHMETEERRVFPYLRQLCSAYDARESYGKLFVRTLGRSLDAIPGDHNRIAAALKELRAITNGYRFADGACTNHQVIYHKLREFDDDLVQHKHLENNVLFPRVDLMEKELRSL
jgi:regulator of cell morphogenesis and NO signaling